MNPQPDISPVVIAVDAGTGSARALAFDSTGTMLAQASREWSHLPLDGVPGSAVFDTTQGWRLITEAIAEVLRRLDGREVAAIGASSMREGFVLYNRHGEEIFACPNADGRARRQADTLVAEGIADRVYALGGDWVSITAPSRLRWLAEEQPDVLQQARHLGMISDWVSFRLSGEFSTDPTCGSSTALFDLSTRRWCAELADLVGIREEILPPVFECGSVIGRVTEQAAAETGLPVGLPVIVGGADTQFALHGIAASTARPTIVAGTFWQTTALLDEPLIDPQRRLRTLCHVDPQLWMVEGIGFLSGLAMRWFRDGFCPDAQIEAERRGTSAFTVMEEWADGVPAGSNDVLAVLSAIMQADGWHHAAPSIVGFNINDPEHHHRGTVVRAIEEAAGYVARGHLEILDEISNGRVRQSGQLTLTGGSSNGALWPSVVAGITGHRVTVAPVPEATSLGVARLAAAAVGLSMPAALGGRLVDPAPTEVTDYDRHYRRWLSVYESQMDATAATGLNSLFTPPGGLPHRPHPPNPQ